MTTKRCCRIRVVLHQLLGRKVTTGQVLEVVMGHLTYAFMVYRPALAICSSVYKFVRASYTKPCRMWKSVILELILFYNIMPLMQYSWSTHWSSHVLATDACLGGYEVPTAEFGVDSVRDIRRSARSRTSAGRSQRTDPNLLLWTTAFWRCGARFSLTLAGQCTRTAVLCTSSRYIC